MEIKSYLWNIIQYKSYTKLIPLPIPAAFESFNSNSGNFEKFQFNSNYGNFEKFQFRNWIGVGIAATIGPNPDWEASHHLHTVVSRSVLKFYRVELYVVFILL